MNQAEQLKLIDLETPREAAERRHKEYVARFRAERLEARQKGVQARHREKLRRAQDQEVSHGVSETLTWDW